MARSKKLQSPSPGVTTLRAAFSNKMVSSAFSMLMLSISEVYPEVISSSFLQREDEFAKFFISLLKIHYYIDKRDEDIIKESEKLPEQ